MVGGNEMFYEWYRSAIAALLVAFCSQAASGDFIDFSGGGLNIPDNNAGGVTSVLNIATDETISDLSVTIFDFQHTWIGDLTARITSPGGTTADLFVRPRTNIFFFGDSSNLDGDYTFLDGGNDLVTEAANRNGTQRIRPNRDYAASSTNGAPVSLAALFAGESTAGNWSLFISDRAGGDVGSIDSWGLSFVSTGTPASVPEPSSMVYFALTGLVLIGRRSRRSRRR